MYFSKAISLSGFFRNFENAGIKLVEKALHNEIFRLMKQDVLSRITFNPEQCGGKPCIRNMRIRVTDVLSLLANGLTTEQIINEMPDLTPEDIQASLIYAASRIDHPVIKAA